MKKVLSLIMSGVLVACSAVAFAQGKDGDMKDKKMMSKDKSDDSKKDMKQDDKGSDVQKM